MLHLFVKPVLCCFPITAKIAAELREIQAPGFLTPNKAISKYPQLAWHILGKKFQEVIRVTRTNISFNDGSPKPINL